MCKVCERLRATQARIAAAARQAGRDPASVTLLAVSKTQPVERIRVAAECGQRLFGENFLQEAAEKIAATEELGLEWHFIGPLQSNKTRGIAEGFGWVHSVDRRKIAERLSAQRPGSLGPLNICLQVNLSGETSKSGVTPQALPELAAAVGELPRIRLRGLMAIPAPTQDPAQQRRDAADLRVAQESLAGDGFELDTLSIGMSNDMEAAIAEGSTLVRIGTAVFGPRQR
ncbi:MAG: YggS family pyridoxal phosphate-dependent enzyme [Gammaproteobacteria bacterium]